MSQRRALLRDVSDELRGELKHFPVQPRGLDARPGFKWLPR